MLAKIAEIETEIARTQKNKATNYHIGLLKAKLAKLRQQLVRLCVSFRTCVYHNKNSLLLLTRAALHKRSCTCRSMAVLLVAVELEMASML